MGHELKPFKALLGFPVAESPAHISDLFFDFSKTGYAGN